MRIDLWVPTASPMATPSSSPSSAGRPRPAGGHHLGWRARGAVRGVRLLLPYAEDGRIPAPSGTGLLEPLTTLSFLAASTTTVRLGTAMVLLPSATRSTRPRRCPPSTGFRTAGSTSASGWGGWRRSSTPSTSPGPPGGSGPTSTSRCWGPCGATRPRPTRASSTPSTRARCTPSPSNSPTRRCTSAGSRGQPWPGWPGPARDGTPSTGPRGAGRAPGHPGRDAGYGGRTRADVTITVCPYFQPLDADIAGRYAEAGADAVAALLLPFSEDDVVRALDDLQPVFDRAAAS